MFRKTTIITPAGLTGARPGPVPERLLPQLATLTEAPPAGADWLHEIKWDGYRMTITAKDGRVRLWTRNGYDWTHRLPKLAAAIEDMGLQSAAFDSELVCLDGEGKTDFERLQAWVTGGPGRPLLYLFDLVHFDGTDLTGVALADRKELLSHLLEDRADRGTSCLRYSDHVAGSGPVVFTHACRMGLEGIVSKRATSLYQPGKRSIAWLKSKNPLYNRPFNVTTKSRKV